MSPFLAQVYSTSMVLGATLPGGAGGFAWFLLGVTQGKIRRKMYWRKAGLEAAGGMLVATFLGPFVGAAIRGEGAVMPVSFALGVGWSSVIQTVRKSITTAVEARLGGKGGGDDETKDE